MDVNDNFTQSVHQAQMDRIAELERYNDGWRGKWMDQKKRAEQAEAALAERDRMLRLAVELLAGMVSDHGPRDVTEDEVLADLKARAEESHEGIDEDAPICPECRVSDVMGTGTKHLRSCSRADEAKP